MRIERKSGINGDQRRNGAALSILWSKSGMNLMPTAMDSTPHFHHNMPLPRQFLCSHQIILLEIRGKHACTTDHWPGDDYTFLTAKSNALLLCQHVLSACLQFLPTVINCSGKATQMNLLLCYCAQLSVPRFLLLFPAYALGLASTPLLALWSPTRHSTVPHSQEILKCTFGRRYSHKLQI